MKHTYAISIFIASMLLYSCGSQETTTADQANQPVAKEASERSAQPLFELLDQTKTGVDFVNTLVEDERVNFYRYQYLYNGGGVAIGDINNDGLNDLYFTATLTPDKLYLNKGNFQFEDISESAGISQALGLKTGVTMADINQDGFLDILVCRSGWYSGENEKYRANLIYLNNGDNTFREAGAETGLGDTGHSIQNVVFDYDKDGDLDVFLTNHPINFKQQLGDRLANAANPEDAVRDKLYQNNGDGTFTDVSRKAGIVTYGHGLGPGVSDINNDGWPDIYVANDFQTQDYYFINNGDGTFTESLAEHFPHCSYFAMGMDIADINNDGNLDVLEVEMLAADNKRQKTNMAPMNPEIFWVLVEKGFHFQYMRNSLHLNNGNGHFSDIAYMAGVSNTDWSWAALLADFDLDGYKDMMITNGYINDTQDKDYVKQSNKMSEKTGGKVKYEQLRDLLPSTRLQNYMFRNTGELYFEDKSHDWGFNFTGYSNGAAYGDLDNDGDLDLVVNNFNDPACVYQNKAVEQGGRYLNVALKGPKMNDAGYGAKLTLHTDAGTQFQEFHVTRGFHSAVAQQVHFGLGEAQAEKLVVEWPDGKVQTIEHPAANSVLNVSYKNAKAVDAEVSEPMPLFVEHGNFKTGFNHSENDFNDFETEILIPHKESQMGPRLAVNRNGEEGPDDVFVCGAAGQPSAYLKQNNGKTFSELKGPWTEDAAWEDIAAHFFDADGDGDNDLYVCSGGNEFRDKPGMLQDRLYLRDGDSFSKASDALPQMPTSTGTVVSADFDADGDLDLFVGGRIVPGKYPFAPRSYILQNDGGTFSDVTETVAPDLMEPGLVTSATWTDYNGDSKPDLIVVGEWTAVLVFENTGGKLESRTNQLGLADKTGWWWKVLETDIDQDGDPDYVLGNLGENYKYQTSAEEPFQVYCSDFDNSGTYDIVLGYYNDGQCFPVRGRQCSSEQMPFIAEKFPTYAAFGEASIDEVYGDDLKSALHYTANTFSSYVMINTGSGFELKPLPRIAQAAPIMGAIAADFTGNQQVDLLVAGNLFVAEVETPRADGGTGLLLSGNGSGSFATVPISQSGFFANKDVRDIALLQTSDETVLIVVANNDGPVQFFTSLPPWTN